MRRETQAERAAWTAHIEGKGSTRNKYGAVRSGKYASKHEEKIATNLQMLASRGLISDLKEQVRITLLPGNGKIRPVVYIADFTYQDVYGLHVVDAKGFKTPVYRLKKRLAALLLGIEIEEEPKKEKNMMNTDTHMLEPLDSPEAEIKAHLKGWKVFQVGETVTIKDTKFTVTDIQPTKLVLRPHGLNMLAQAAVEATHA